VALIVDENNLGTTEERWRDAGLHESLPPVELINARRLVVVSPHPDDEVFGAGGLIQTALSQRVPVEVVGVTDGEASHPNSSVASTLNLPRVRSDEAREALGRLGWRSPLVTRLHLSDGAVTENRDELDAALAGILLPDDLCVAPWRHDGHPDHDACGESALAASRAVGARALGFLVWAWHWDDPERSAIPWEDCRRLDLTRRARARKRWASAAFDSQTRSLGPGVEDAAVLPAPLMRRFWRPYEVFVDETASSP
jgi:LmbE family N-acetylglucosaminyl deacetylase